MLMFTLAILFDHFHVALIHGPNIPGSYSILFFRASNLASITNHTHNWVLFFLWLHLFILSGVISPLISSSILGTYQPGKFIFQCPIFLPFDTAHGVLTARILKWFAILYYSGPHFARTLHHVCPSLAALHSMAHTFTEWSMWSVSLVFCDCGFHSVCPLIEKDTRFMDASWWQRLTVEATGSFSGGRGHAQ